MAITTTLRTGRDDAGAVKTLSHTFDSYLPYDDPAFINPAELATFPKVAKPSGELHGHDSHFVNRRTPVRDGSYITRTDNHPAGRYI
ncbi:hypothetical protein [Flavobacterium rhizosphaerae]|uniref:Uncharacterized protein n=1 Tax=Flavobacterium rhizosphaerae TaxID=3163298 RepID=A0ABW8Z082_9FLAO